MSILYYIDTRIKGKPIPLSILNTGWLILLAGLSSLFALSAGFVIYALILYLISLIMCFVCPCIGAAGFAGTTAIWATLFVADLYVAIFFMALLGICGLIVLLSWISSSYKNIWVLIGGLFQASFGGLAYYLYSNLLHNVN